MACLKQRELIYYYVQGTIQACNEIMKRLEPVKEKMTNPSWAELVAAGHKQNVELCATHM